MQSNTIPCPGQKCGVQTHIAGSQAATLCSATSVSNRATSINLSTPVQLSGAFTNEYPDYVFDRREASFDSLQDQLDSEWDIAHDGAATMKTGDYDLDRERGPVLMVYGSDEEWGEQNRDHNWLAESRYIVLRQSNDFEEDELFPLDQEPPVGHITDDGLIIFDADESSSVEDDTAALMNWASKRQRDHMRESGQVKDLSIPGSRVLEVKLPEQYEYMGTMIDMGDGRASINIDPASEDADDIEEFKKAHGVEAELFKDDTVPYTQLRVTGDTNKVLSMLEHHYEEPSLGRDVRNRLR